MNCPKVNIDLKDIQQISTIYSLLQYLRIECDDNQIFRCDNCGRFVHIAYTKLNNESLHNLYMDNLQEHNYFCIDCIKDFYIENYDRAIATEQAELRWKHEHK